MNVIYRLFLAVSFLVIYQPIWAQNRHEILIVAPKDNKDGPLNISFLNKMTSFLKKFYDFPLGEIQPKNEDGTLFRIESLEEFKQLLTESLKKNSTVEIPLEFSIFFISHGGLRTEEGKKHLVLWTGPATDRLIKFNDYLTAIKTAIEETQMENKITLNIYVGSCHSGQCVAEYNEHPISQTSYRKAVFGSVDENQTTFNQTYLYMWKIANRMDQFLQQLENPILPMGTQFERWSKILSSFPLRVDGGSRSTFIARPVMSGTYLDRHILSLDELLAYGVAIPLMKWGVDSYKFVIKELKNRFKENGVREEYERILKTKYQGVINADLLRFLVDGDDKKVLQIIIKASNRVDSFKIMSRKFLEIMMSEYLNKIEKNNFNVSTRMAVNLRAQYNLYSSYRYLSSLDVVINESKKFNKFDLSVVRYLLCSDEENLIVEIFNYLLQQGKEDIFSEAAFLELSQAIGYAEQDEETERHGIRLMFVNMMMSGIDQLSQWVEDNLYLLTDKPSKELESFKKEIVKSLTYWRNPLYQLVTLRLAEATQALSKEEVQRAVSQISPENLKLNELKMFNKYKELSLKELHEVRTHPVIDNKCAHAMQKH